MSEAGSEAARSTRDLSRALKAEGAGIAAGVAVNAAERGKSLIDELEALARRNPLGMLAGAMVIGNVLASWRRRRR